MAVEKARVLVWILGAGKGGFGQEELGSGGGMEEVLFCCCCCDNVGW